MAKQQKKKYYQRMTGKLMLQLDPCLRKLKRLTARQNSDQNSCCKTGAK